MRGSRKRPAFDIETAKALVERGEYSATGRVVRFLMNHGYSPEDTIEDVFTELRADDFRESYSLEHYDGAPADVYIVRLDDDDWYVKFTLHDEDGRSVLVLTCCQDGYQH